MRRTAGITHITLFTEPASCGGSCLFCPRVPDTPHSYLPHSHVSRVGLTYDAQQQARHWLDAVERSGRAAAKLEVIVLGGSFSAHPVDYQETFLSGIYRAAEALPAGHAAPLAELVERHAAGSGHRIIGITVECRPDQVTPELCRRLFRCGVTKIEMGVQSLDDDVLAFNDRGHDAATVARATAIIRASGLKIGYHLMLGLPSATGESDARTADAVFTDPAYQPDHLKIYFCEMFRKEFMRPRLVDLYDRGAWRPLDAAERDARLAALMPTIPPFIRISRIGRKSAPDEVVGQKVRLDRATAERRHGCGCIRCREPRPRETFDANAVVLRALEPGPGEVYLEAQIEGRKTCLGVLRLRINAEEAIVRELHVYGIETPPGEEGLHQHRGIGRRLMERAEALARAAGLSSIAVASGPGVRGYYRKLGYRVDDRDRMARDLGAGPAASVPPAVRAASLPARLRMMAAPLLVSLSTLLFSQPAAALPVTFVHDDGTARSVSIAGAFNRWSATATPLAKSGERWTVTVDLEPGIHEYKFVVDGDRWRPDPRNLHVAGISENSVLRFRTATDLPGNFTRDLARCVFTIPDAGYSEVSITGEFCRWNDRLYPLRKAPGSREWRGIFYLPATPTDLGVLADGEWMPLGREADPRGFFTFPEYAARWRVAAETRPLATSADALTVTARILPPAHLPESAAGWTARAWLNNSRVHAGMTADGAITVVAAGLRPGPNGLRIDAVREGAAGLSAETAIPAYVGILRDPTSAPAPAPLASPLLPLPTDPDSAAFPGYYRLPPGAADAIIYQVMVPRFRDSDGDGIGDLQGVIADLPRIADLGANWIYLLPIFEAPTQHGYHTTDYFTIDRDLGTPDDFTALCDAAHKLGLKVMLDYVFNHSSADHPLFRAAYADPSSHWRSWHRWKGRDSWSGFGDGRSSMPGWNFDEPLVRRYAIDVGLYWLDAGIDGWRCDVAHGVPDDFWLEWSAALRARHPGVLLFPEFDEPGFDLYYDGAATEIFAVLEGRKTPFVLDAALNAGAHEGSRFPVRYVSYHDRDRLLTAAGGNRDRALLGMAFLMTTPGAPMLYYGEEFGMDGAMGSNTNREFPPWGAVEYTTWSRHRELIRLRRDHAALRRGVSRRVDLGNDRVYAFTRSTPDEELLVVLNLSDRPQTVTFPRPAAILLGSGAEQLVASHLATPRHALSLAPLGYAILKLNH